MKMKGMAIRYCTHFYHGLCIATAMGMFVYCVYQYEQNRDVSMVDFREMNDEDDNIYPAVSICISTRLLEKTMENGSTKTDLTNYWSFLSGDYWDDEYLDVSYDNVTKSIEKFFLGASVWNFYTLEKGWIQHFYPIENFKNDSDYDYDYLDNPNFKPKLYTSFRDSHEKCLSIDIPNYLKYKISIFELFFNNSIFGNGNRPRVDGFGIKIHYPNQFLTATCAKYSWKKHKLQEDYTMKFAIQNVIVLNRRNKRKFPCTEDWMHHDQVIRRNIMKEVGCQPPHWDRITDLPKCSSPKQMKYFYELNVTSQYHPCKQIKKVIYAYEELKYIEDNPLEWAKAPNDTIFKIMVEFKDSSFMEIMHVRAFDIESLIGNAGGYLGLFTGYALLQLPNLVILISRWLCKIRNRCVQSHNEIVYSIFKE